MSQLIQAIIIFASAQVCTLSVSSQTVIADDAAIIPLLGHGQYLSLTNSINPSQGRFGLFAIEIISLSASQFTFSYAGVAEEYGLYAITPGIAIDPAFAAGTTPLVSNNGVDPGSSVQMFSLGQSRYFGYWDDRQFGQGAPDENDLYGWVLIRRTTSGLQVTSSATAIGGGIIAGTFTPIPEPSTRMLTVLVLLLCLCLKHFGFRT